MEYTNLIGDPWTNMPYEGTLLPQNYTSYSTSSPLSTPQLSQGNSGIFILIIGVVILLAIVFVLLQRKNSY